MAHTSTRDRPIDRAAQGDRFYGPMPRLHACAPRANSPPQPEADTLVELRATWKSARKAASEQHGKARAWKSARKAARQSQLASHLSSHHSKAPVTVVEVNAVPSKNPVPQAAGAQIAVIDVKAVQMETPAAVDETSPQVAAHEGQSSV